MKQSLRISIFALLILSATSITTFAQKLNGIRIDSRDYPVVVYLNNELVSEPVNSIFISNLRSGAYRVDVYKQNPRNASRDILVLSETINYRNGIVPLVVPEGKYGYNGGKHPVYIPTEMRPNEFNMFCKAVKSESFDSGRYDHILLAIKTGAVFSVDQVVELAKFFSFDDGKMKMIKKIYPTIVDKDRSVSLLGVFTFSSNKTELRRFIENEIDSRY